MPRPKKTLVILVLLFCTALLMLRVLAQNPGYAGEVLMQQANQLYENAQFTQALSVWQQAIATLPPRSLNQAAALSNLSLTYQQLGQWQPAQAAVSQSLAILSPLGKNPEQTRILAQTLDIQGQLFHRTGRSREALETWQQAAKITPNPLDKKRNQIYQAQALQDMGLYPRACQTLLEVLNFNSRECQVNTADLAAIQTQKNHDYQAKALRSLGNVLRVIGNLKQSEKVLQVSLKINQKSPEDLSKTLLNLGNTEWAIASRAREIDDVQQIEIYQEKALDSYQKAAQSSVVAIKTQAQLNQVELLINQEEWTKAEEIITKIKPEIDKLALNRETIYLNINYTKNHLCLEQKQTNCLNPTLINLSLIKDSSLQQAQKNLEKAVQDAGSLEDLRTQSYAQGMLARLYESRQAWQPAQDLTKQALFSSWQAQAPELTYQWQWQQARLLKAQGKNQEALRVYEQTVQTLKSLRSDLVSINPEIQFTFRESIEPIYREYVGLLLSPPNPQQALAPENLQKAREIIDSLQLAELENFFRLVCLDANPVVIDQVTDKNDPNAAVIYPILLEDRFEVILKLPQQPLRHYSTPIEDQRQVERILARLSQSLTQANSQETLPLAQQVYNWLLRPAAADLSQSQVKTLVFVLDSALRNVPMAVLHDGQKYLVENYSIALIPSLQLLAPQTLQVPRAKALFAGLSEARGKFPALPFVPQEIQQISQQIPRSVELLNETFTNTSFKDAVNSAPFSVVHLATHGQFSSQAEETFVLTWDVRLNIEQLNSLIRARDNQPIELLVLSACETLTGDRRASLGLAGVAVRAGARSTLATLWQVNDQTTALLMNQFYAALQEGGITKAQALRQAQLKLLEDPTYRRPHFWAPYVLVGNWL